MCCRTAITTVKPIDRAVYSVKLHGVVHVLYVFQKKSTRGSGNVFADLGLPNPEERLAKAQLAHAIAKAIKERGLTQREAAALMGIDQPKVSHVLRGRLADFSTERLMNFLTGLDRDMPLNHTDLSE